jgi:soluble lytic murein transglycosylase
MPPAAFAQSLAQENGGSWLRYLYPQAYWQTVSTQARTKQLDPYLVLALIRQESLFNPEAVSPAQAYGLMQLLPKTAARVTKESTVSPRSMDPEFNIDAGTTYLRQLLDL